MSSVIPHDHVRTTTATTITRTAIPAASCAGSPPPTTRTSARCTCGSRSPCSWSAACMALTIRAELFEPGLQLVKPEFFNQLTTLHGLIMIFGAIMPAAVGFANWQIPMMIGAPDMAFARMNNWSFWLLPFGGHAADRLVLRARRRPPARLDLYAPLSVQARHGHGPDDLRHPHHGRVVDHGLDQHHHHHPQHARARHDADEDAAVRAGPG